MALGAYEHVHGRRERQRAGLAHHLAADVVAVLRVGEHLDVDQHAVVGLQHDELRVAQALAPGASIAGSGPSRATISRPRNQRVTSTSWVAELVKSISVV